MAQITRQTHHIHPYQVDPQRRLTIPALIDLMHIAAWQSAADLGASVYDLHAQGITWAMIKYRLEVFEYFSHDAQVHIETWPSGSDRTFVYRDYRAYNRDGKLMAQASSTWLVMDLQTRRMTSLKDYMRPLIQVPEGCSPLPRVNQRLRQLPDPQSSMTFPVRWHELDPNGHVTNTIYFLWALESLGADWLNQHQLRQIEIHFKAEMKAGDQISSAFQAIDELSFTHEMKRVSDGKLVALGYSNWE